MWLIFIVDSQYILVTNLLKSHLYYHLYLPLILLPRCPHFPYDEQQAYFLMILKYLI